MKIAAPAMNPLPSPMATLPPVLRRDRDSSRALNSSRAACCCRAASAAAASAAA